MRRPDGTVDVELYVIRAGDRLERVLVQGRDYRKSGRRSPGLLDPAVRSPTELLLGFNADLFTLR